MYRRENKNAAVFVIVLITATVCIPNVNGRYYPNPCGRDTTNTVRPVYDARRYVLFPLKIALYPNSTVSTYSVHKGNANKRNSARL